MVLSTRQPSPVLHTIKSTNRLIITSVSGREEEEEEDIFYSSSKIYQIHFLNK
jgi:hypothetical protein